MAVAPRRPPLGEVTRSDRVLDAEAVRRAVVRLAHEVVERHPGLDGVVVAAIRDGGVPMARALVAALGRLAPEPPLLALDVRSHRDDRPRPLRAPAGAVARIAADGAPVAGIPSLDGAAVVLVDDVVHTGRTLRAALDLLAERGRPASVEALVLVDRGSRELPLRATYVGRNLPVPASSWVEVVIDGGDAVEPGAYLVGRPQPPARREPR